jgi:hypothetical protein
MKSKGAQALAQSEIPQNEDWLRRQGSAKAGSCRTARPNTHQVHEARSHVREDGGGGRGGQCVRKVGQAPVKVHGVHRVAIVAPARNTQAAESRSSRGGAS